MNDSNQRLRQKLKDILGESMKIYLQPPEKTTLKFPCAIYTMRDMNRNCADNALYALKNVYDITYITNNPLDENIKKLATIPEVSFKQTYSVDGLYHFIYSIYI